MAVFDNKKRPWLNGDQEMQSRLWVDEKQEDIAKILPKEKCIDHIPVRCHSYWVPCIAIGLSCLIMGRHGFLVPFEAVLRYWIFLLALTAIFWPLETFIFHKPWGYIEIYPEMMAVYEYDGALKRLYLSGHYDWIDITHYDSGIDGIRIDFISGQYICFKAKRKKFYPYLLQYAPQAKKLTYEDRRMRAKVQRQEEKKREQERKKENVEYERLMKARKAARKKDK